jgi:hypothetical protein
LHVAVAFAGGTQGVHEVPHDAVLRLSEQTPLQLWLVALQAYPQAVPLHVAVALTGGTQGVHDEPQVSTESLLAQRAPQRW